jgi:hypothetical protein
MTTGTQDRQIAELLTSNLEYIIDGREITIRSSDMGFLIDYVQSNMNPDDVFDIGDLRDWAFRNGFVEE